MYAEYQVQHLAAENDVGGAGALAALPLNPMVADRGRVPPGALRHGDADRLARTRSCSDESLAWVAGVVTITLVVSLVGLRLAWGYFFNRSGDFAEEL